MTVSDKAAETMAHVAHEKGAFSPPELNMLWDMEERFWTSDAKSAQTETAGDAVMIFLYPPGILQGEGIWENRRQSTGWRSVVMAERRVTRRRDNAILTYRVSAEKADEPIYKALCASTYLFDEDKWSRLSHQQTIAM